MYQGAYETGEIRELAQEAQTYVNESANEAEAVDRGVEVIGILNESIDYFQQSVVLQGLYKRAFILKEGKSKRFLDSKPFIGISDGFMVADFRTSFSQIPETKRQKSLLAEMQEFTDGHYVVCHRVMSGAGKRVEPDSLIVEDVSAYAMAPIGSAAVFPHRIEAVDELMTPERQDEAQRIIASAGPFYRDLMDKIEADIAHEDIVKGLMYSARKFRGICENGDHFVKSAAVARLSALTLERLQSQVIMISGNLPTSLIIKDGTLLPASLVKHSYYVFAPERVATAPFFKQPKPGAAPEYEKYHGLYLMGRLLNNFGESSDPILLPLEHMHETEILKASRPITQVNT